MGDPARPVDRDDDEIDLEGIEPPPGILYEDDPRLVAEAERRLARMKSGEDPGIPWKDVRAMLRGA